MKIKTKHHFGVDARYAMQTFLRSQSVAWSRIRRRLPIPLGLVIAVALLAVTAAADEPNPKLRLLIDNSIGWFKLFPNATSTQPMKPLVALRWDNNTRESASGATVLWLAKGRPEAVAAIFPWQTLFVHEFDSLSRGKIVAKLADKVVWRPKSAGLQFRPIEGTSRPSRSAKTRLTQMKLLTKRFSAKLLGWANDSSQHQELRMLPTPLYRYKIDEPQQVQDGAIFAYVSGTDPEIFLVIESFRTEGAFQWQYAFVRRTSGGLEGRFRNKVVWTAKKYPRQRDPTLNHREISRPLNEALETVESAVTP